MNSASRTNQLTAHLAALGDQARLRMLRLLEREELSVGELARVVQLPQSTVSRHLKILAESAGAATSGRGWIAKRAEGTATLYRMVLDDLLPASRALWLTVRDQMGSDSAELLEDHRRLQGVLGERRTDTQSFFGRVAGEWDVVRNDLFGQTFTPHALLTLLPSDWAVADLGCGTGNAAELLAPLVRRVFAIDQSGPMLAAARKRLSGAPNVEFLEGPLEALPLAPASVDAAVCVLVLHHLVHPAKAVAELSRILKPGGLALVIDMVQHNRDAYRQTMGHRWQGFSETAMLQMVADADLTNPRYLVLPTDPNAKGPALFACTARRAQAQR